MGVGAAMEVDIMNQDELNEKCDSDVESKAYGVFVGCRRSCRVLEGGNNTRTACIKGGI